MTLLAQMSDRRNLRTPAVVSTLAFLTVVDLFATQAILPMLVRRYEVAPAVMGLAVNASTLGMALSSLCVALFSPLIDRRRGIILSLLALAAPTALLAIAPSVAAFAALRIAQGLCMASAFTLTIAYLGETFGATAAGASGVFAAYITGNVASNLFGRLFSAALASHLGLGGNFLGFALLNLAGAALAYRTIVAPPAPMPMMSALAAGMRAAPWSALATHLRNPALRAGFAVGFCILFAFIGIFTFVNFVLVRAPLQLDMMSVGLVYFVFLPSILTTPVAGRFVARLGARSAIWRGLGVAALGLPMLLTSNLAIVLFGLALVAIGTFFAQAVATGFIGQAARSDRGAASGMYLACYFSGGLAGTAILGPVFDRFGWPACVIGVGCVLALAASLATRMRVGTAAAA